MRPGRSFSPAEIERLSNFIWQKKWTWSYGAQLLATDERGVFSAAGVKDTRTFFIAALPLTLGYDGSDNLLDPTRGFRLSGLISPEYSGHGDKPDLCSLADRRERLSPGFRPCRGRRANPPRNDRRRERLRPRALAALLFGRRRIGSRLRLSAARAQGCGGRPDRRPRPRRIRDRKPHPPEAVRRQFRHRTVLRRRIADHRGAAGLQAIGVSRSALACVIIRASDRSASISASRSTGRRATGRSPSPSRSGRPSDGRRQSSSAKRRADQDAASDATGHGASSTSCSRCSSRFCSCSRRCSSCSTARRATASSSTGSASSRPRRASASGSGESTGRSSASRSCATLPLPTSAACS